MSQPEPVPPTAPVFVAPPDSPPPLPKGRMARTWGRVKAYREAHATAEMAVFFAAGFLFDLVTLARIDDAVTLIQQGVYLTILGFALGLETRQSVRGDLPKWLARGLEFSEDVIHFFFGSLLSSFALFYFKSASGVTALIFTVVLFGLLVANELPRFRKLGPVVRYAIFSFSLTSYLAYLFPVLFGFLHPALFVAACAVAALIIYGVYWLLSRWGISRGHVLRRAILPAGIVQVLLIALYFLKVIPPVPLSLNYFGIYHGVENIEGRRLLLHERPWWRFWHNGDQLYRYRPGDKLYGFTVVFAPTDFKDQLYIRWSKRGEKGGWLQQDAIPIKISGGRAEGYRAHTVKQNFSAGDWRAEIETADGRTVGSIRFAVVYDLPNPDGTYPARVFKVDTY